MDQRRSAQRKIGKAASGNQESKRKEKIGGSTRKTIGFWTNHKERVRNSTNLIHLGLVA
jgi:hypothetical protein